MRESNDSWQPSENRTDKQYIPVYRDELISDILPWTPSHGRAKAGRPARTYTQQLCEDTGCSPEDLPDAMNDREGCWERVWDIRADGTTRWWWALYGTLKYVWFSFFTVAKMDSVPQMLKIWVWAEVKDKILNPVFQNSLFPFNRLIQPDLFPSSNSFLPGDCNSFFSTRCDSSLLRDQKSKPSSTNSILKRLRTYNRLQRSNRRQCHLKTSDATPSKSNDIFVSV